VKKKTIYIIFLLSALGGISYYFSNRLMNTGYYNRICGSGLNGMRGFMIHYLPYILIISLIIYIYIHYNRLRCPNCKKEIKEDFNSCPFCGTTIQKRGK